jgi:inner membrane protein
MDWTNNYGVRFLLPWNSQWFYGDLVFIIDPLLWLTLGGSVFLLTSETKKQIVVWLAITLITGYLVFFGPTSRGGLTNATLLRIVWLGALVTLFVLFKKGAAKRWGAKIPISAFVVVAVYLSALCIVQSMALKQAKSDATRIAAEHNEQSMNVAAMPTLANPLQWQVVFDTEQAAYRFNLALWRSSVPSDVVRYERPDPSRSRAVELASRDSRARVFLGFARFPVVEVAGEDCTTQTLVQFADLRYTEPGRSRGTFTLEVPVDCPTLDRR